MGPIATVLYGALLRSSASIRVDVGVKCSTVCTLWGVDLGTFRPTPI